MVLKALQLLGAASVAVSALNTWAWPEPGPWPNVCVSGNQYSPWNATSCNTGATCCPNDFSVSKMGCCPYENAVCCAGGFQCCPGGTTCVLKSGSGYDTVFSCQANGVAVQDSVCSCKSGPPLPLSTIKKNVLIIGDSVSIGYTPYVNTALQDIAMVQHSPWDVSDGGAEETAYGLQCLPYFLSSPSGMDIKPDVVMFNFGLHDGPLGNTTTPGQQGNSSMYAPELLEIATQIKAWAAARGSKVLFALTSPMLCDAVADDVVLVLNSQALAIMTQLKIPTISLHDAIVGKCGPVPQASCFGLKGCYCPHCPPGYEWLAQSYIAPAIRNLLTA